MRSAMQKDTAKLLRWLNAFGCPVDILDIESSIRIEQQVGDDVTHVFELPDGRTGCVLSLRIINEGPGPRSIRDLEFEMPWSNFGFHLLPDPREAEGPYKNLYRFPSDSLGFPRHMVLNHVLLPDCILQPNHPRRGLLLGIGNRMSTEIRHGTPVTGVLSIITDSGTPGICEIELWAERMSMARAAAKKRRPRYSGLFEQDPGAGVSAVSISSDDEINQSALTQDELETMKSYAQKHAPTTSRDPAKAVAS
jgi:hypothetical protein